MSEPIDPEQVHANIDPQVESYIEGIPSDADPSEGHSPKSQQSSHGSDYWDIENKQPPVIPDPEDPGKEKPVSYTNLVVDAKNCWLCPKCRMTADVRLWAYKERGYRELPPGYDRLIPVCYGLKSLRERSVYFRNPSKVAEWMNQWNEGRRGSRCGFNREAVEGFRREDLEEADQCGTLVDGTSFAYCPTCSFIKEDVEYFPELKMYMDEETKLGYYAGTDRVKPSYIWREKDPWEGRPRFMRPLLYHNDDKEILKCPSLAFGEGMNKGSETTRCDGRYGAPVVFWETEVSENGDVESYERDWEPTDVNPAPMTPPLRPEDFSSSSDGIPSDSDQGQDPGDWYSSS